MHVTHRLHIVLLTFVQLCLQQIQLSTQALYLYIKVRDVMANGINGATLALNLSIDNHQILQTLAHVFLVGTEQLLLLLNFLLNLLALILQSLYCWGGDIGLTLATLARFTSILSFTGFTSLTSFTRFTSLTRLLSNGSFLLR